MAYSLRILLKTFPTTAPKIILLLKPRNSPIKAIQQQNKPLINSISKFNFLISPTALSKSRIAIPDTYQRIEQHEKGITDMIHAMVDGTIEVADIMIFIFILGGMIGVINKTGAFNAGLMSLTKKTKGNEFSVVFAVCVLMLLGGTACGIEEEAVAFYPILVPVFLALGYDSIVCVGAIFLAASMGTAFSTINPFSVVIALKCCRDSIH